jgi:hypothetical protein
MKPKLCQIIAVEKGLKKRAYDDLKTVHHDLQKPALLDGFSRTYRPYNDTETEQLPPEVKQVQIKSADIIKQTEITLTEAFDVVATKEWGNTHAKADIVVDGTTLLANVPVGYLLYLEHQLDDLSTFVDKLPVLDPAETWVYDANTACYATQPTETVRTRKVPTVVTKYEATKEHPAQTEIFTEDRPIGRFSVVKRSGALPLVRVNELKNRVAKLKAAVKFAREQANSIEVDQKTVGASVLNFLFT